MVHDHDVFDDDSTFIIDQYSRAITSMDDPPPALMQYDHNSEIFSFEAPRTVEGHDLKNCDKIRIHYINIGASGKKNSDVYEVKEAEVDSEDPSLIRFTWLISNNATQFAGSLNFVIEFLCMSDTGVITYSWRTAIYTDIKVLDSLNNAPVVVEQYADVLQEWKRELDSSRILSITQTVKSKVSGAANVWTATFVSGETSTFEVRNGERGEKSLIGSIETITGDPLHFFVGSKSDYEALPEETRLSSLFAIITDDPGEAELAETISELKEGKLTLGSTTLTEDQLKVLNTIVSSEGVTF